MAVGDTSFEELTVKELKALAEMFAVDLDGKTKKADIITEIKEMGIDWEMYQATLEPDEDAPVELSQLDNTPLDIPEAAPVEEEEESDMVLVKMTRKNHVYEIWGYRFSRQHPFVPVTEEVASYLVEEDEGFRIASPRELREFYGA